jgi:membrane protein implicated in regulation of membrane protease activity
MDERDHERRNRQEARDMLRGELREVVGDERAERAERKGALDEAVEGRKPATVAGAFSESRELIAITFFVALVVGAVIALITGAWWFILVALALHAIGTVAVVGTAFSLATRGESPDPRTAAALEARGVTDPDAALEHAVEVATEGEGGHQGGETSATREPGDPRAKRERGESDR